MSSIDTGYIYLLIEREFIKTNENIYKIGYTKQPNGKRFKDPSSKILIFFLFISRC